MPHFVWSKINGTTARRRSGRTPPPLTKGFRLNRYTRRLHASLCVVKNQWYDSPPQKRQNASTPNKRLSIEPVYTPSACLTAASAACFACRPSCCCCSCSPLHHPVAAVMLLQPPATAGPCHSTSHLSKCPSSPSRACARQRSPSSPPCRPSSAQPPRFTWHTAQSS